MAQGRLLRTQEEDGPCGRRKAMTEKDVRDLLTRWAVAVTRLWSHDVIGAASAGRVECPCYSQDFGKVTVSMSVRGMDVLVGSEATALEQLLLNPIFKLSDMKGIREFVTDAIRKGKAEVAAQVQARKKMMDDGFEGFKSEIAEWNLQCDKGDHV